MTQADRIRAKTDEELAEGWLNRLIQEIFAPPQKKPICDTCKHAIDGVVDDFAAVFCAVRCGYFGQVTECKNYAPREVSDNG